MTMEVTVQIQVKISNPMQFRTHSNQAKISTTAQSWILQDQHHTNNIDSSFCIKTFCHLSFNKKYEQLFLSEQKKKNQITSIS